MTLKLSDNLRFILEIRHSLHFMESFIIFMSMLSLFYKSSEIVNTCRMELKIWHENNSTLFYNCYFNKFFVTLTVNPLKLCFILVSLSSCKNWLENNFSHWPLFRAVLLTRIWRDSLWSLKTTCCFGSKSSNCSSVLRCRE